MRAKVNVGDFFFLVDIHHLLTVKHTRRGKQMTCLSKQA